MQEDVLRRHAFADGDYLATVIMGLLREEWSG